MHTFPFVYFKNRMMPLEQATITIASNSLHYGTSCFGGIRGYIVNGLAQIFRLEDHYTRLMNAVKIMEIPFFINYSNFKAIIGELILRNSPDTDFYIRPIIFSPTERISPRPAGLTFELGIFCISLGEYFNLDHGMRLMISSWRKFSDSSLPTKAKAAGCYVNSFLASAEAVRCGYDEALMADQNGYIVEASVANILISYRGRILTPPTSSAALEGITLRSMLELLQEEGKAVSFEPVDRSMVYTCDELLVLGTAAQICFAESVDDRQIQSAESNKPGPLCQLLRKKFGEVVQKRHPKAAMWLTEFQRTQ